jgi:hypothetical protein
MTTDALLMCLWQMRRSNECIDTPDDPGGRTAVERAGFLTTFAGVAPAQSPPTCRESHRKNRCVTSKIVRYRRDHLVATAIPRS